MRSGLVSGTALDLTDEGATAAWVERTAEAMEGWTSWSPTPAVSRWAGRQFRGRRLPQGHRHQPGAACEPHPGGAAAAQGARLGPHPDDRLRSGAPAQSGLRPVLGGSAGILGYIKGLVDALGDSGVTVNVLAPGYHRTKMLVDQFGSNADTELAKVAAGIPLGRIGDPADFGDLAAFYASRQARFITGAVVMADGGNTRGVG